MKTETAVIVKGNTMDDQTRCVHYHSGLDIIAIKFKCCDTYYPCFKCHEEEATHVSQTWNKEEWSAKAVLCGICKTELSIHQYMESNYNCPACGSSFNPGCKNHNHLYFQD
ncbi:CHY zinc finger protein [Daejeonella oryzae]|uniref:CHY zinc finger protein n=1 Tax=Daejeonella oryzae TaxID=1122943 RepID=UPI00056423CB|nr:CHY zinc finger protein [Daejeonella oryzae]